MNEEKKGELAIRDKSFLHQQRRLKQVNQFTHKDSADLLPLDGLKRLGTSKDLQPHSIVQRRLLEGNVTRLRGEARDPGARDPGARDPGARLRSPLADTRDGPEAEERSESTADDSTESLEDEDEREESAALLALLVQCKCCQAEVKASISTSSQQNHISTSCCRRLGLVPSSVFGSSSVILQLQLGQQKLQCSAQVTEDETFEVRLGLHTLLELKCCLDLNSRVLKLPGCGEELPFLNLQHDTNENL